MPQGSSAVRPTNSLYLYLSVVFMTVVHTYFYIVVDTQRGRRTLNPRKCRNMYETKLCVKCIYIPLHEKWGIHVEFCNIDPYPANVENMVSS